MERHNAWQAMESGYQDTQPRHEPLVCFCAEEFVIVDRHGCIQYEISSKIEGRRIRVVLHTAYGQTAVLFCNRVEDDIKSKARFEKPHSSNVTLCSTQLHPFS